MCTPTPYVHGRWRTYGASLNLPKVAYRFRYLPPRDQRDTAGKTSEVGPRMSVPCANNGDGSTSGLGRPGLVRTRPTSAGPRGATAQTPLSQKRCSPHDATCSFDVPGNMPGRSHRPQHGPPRRREADSCDHRTRRRHAPLCQPPRELGGRVSGPNWCERCGRYHPRDYQGCARRPAPPVTVDQAQLEMLAELIVQKVAERLVRSSLAPRP